MIREKHNHKMQTNPWRRFVCENTEVQRSGVIVQKQMRRTSLGLRRFLCDNDF